ncbi:serine hydrolase [Streptomyces sp. CRN 30]|uniref:serine hydrolase n=1 Tax=Streptomyces sp. CRN 30 TaxID=3075613 RepID=UPI002A80597D|nr:serine hydrolase [Streptomyces sp. CRN 30]
MPSHRVRARARARRLPWLYAVLASVAVAGGTGAGAVYLTGSVGTRGVAPAAASAETTPAAQESEEPVTVDRDALLAQAMASVSVADGAEVSVAVLDTDGGESASYGDAAFDTASIVKVDVLATLLLQSQDAGRSLTAQERTYATAMIEQSDNAATTALWKAIGRADGLDTANARFGLTRTEGGDGELWGLTRTTAADQLTLLRQVFPTDGTDTSELSEDSRTYLVGLMERIADGQDWGVSAAGSSAALKNGWLPRSTTGLWVINSIGRVTADGRTYLVAVVSRGNAAKADGVSLVEAAARAAVSVFSDDTEAAVAVASGSPAAQKSS